MAEHSRLMKTQGGKAEPLSDDEFDEMKESLRRLNLPDVKVD
ncbi:MAG: hypothetical protein ABJL57_11715 [Hyphomonas sp.]